MMHKSQQDKMNLIRFSLTAMLSEDLYIFAYDEPAFRAFYRNLAAQHKHTALVNALLSYTEKTQQIDILSRWIQQTPEFRFSSNKPSLFWLKETNIAVKYLFATVNYICIATKSTLYFLSAVDGSDLLLDPVSLKELAFKGYSISGGVTTTNGDLLLRLIPNQIGQKAYLVALRLIQQETTRHLQILWHYQASSLHITLPCIYRNYVCFIQTNSEIELVTLYAESGVEHNRLVLPNKSIAPIDCISFIHFDDTFYLALRGNTSKYEAGAILSLKPDDDAQINLLRSNIDNVSLSGLAANDKLLFFGSNNDEKGLPKSQVHAFNPKDKDELWRSQLPPDSKGRYRLISGQPLVASDMLFVSGHNHRLHVMDVNDGSEIGSRLMTGRIEASPVSTSHAIVVVDRWGVVCAWPLRPSLIVTCHYDLKTPPIRAESHPLIITVVNQGLGVARKLIVQVSGNFQGESENNTQEFVRLKANELLQRSIRVVPTTAGSSVNLTIDIHYTNVDDEAFNYTVRRAVPVRRNFEDSSILKFEQGSDLAKTYQYNYVALSALISAVLPHEQLNQFCNQHFRDVCPLLLSGMREEEKHWVLIKHIDTTQQVEKLLNTLAQHNQKWFAIYIKDIKRPLPD